MARLVIISNRLPFTLRVNEGDVEFGPSSGGLVSALSAYLQRQRQDDPEFECVWVGWPGMSVAPELEDTVRERCLSEHQAHPVFLSRRDTDAFYDGFCNGTLWPLFHYFPTYTAYDPNHFETYVRVNRQFCTSVLEVLRPDDRIWIHDYQLLLLPGMLREALPDATIGFFLHIPFPSYELLRLLPTPWRRELLSGMLGADLVGFHTHEYTQHFLHSVFRTLGFDHHLGQIDLEDQTRRADTFPIGIDFEHFMTAARGEAVAARCAQIADGILGRKAIFSVDRLDYTKGILNRLRGYEEFLLRYPEWHNRVVFLLTVVPSRDAVSQYRRMKHDLDERVGQINGRFGTMEWVPIVYQYRALDFETLVALYQVSPIALITPLRDGMNLVAKEFLASKPDSTGVLILSEMAGAARELPEAVIINPNHLEEIADALKQALTMSEEEQVRRNVPMQERLRTYDARRWADQFLRSLSRVKSAQGHLATKHITPAIQRDLVAQYCAAERPLILLDYDGTLVPFAPQPNLATPDAELQRILGGLAAHTRNHTFVISGRNRTTLDAWLGGGELGLIAEHGAWMREPRGDWHLLKPLASHWKESITPILHMYVDRVAGSLIEEKEFSVAWHYRLCDPELGAQRAKELIDEVTQFTANFAVQVLEGKKVVEIRNAGVNKGAAAAHVVAGLEPDFILAMGDDLTDEDLFRALPAGAATVRVGAPFSNAKYSVPGVAEVRALLQALVRQKLVS